MNINAVKARTLSNSLLISETVESLREQHQTFDVCFIFGSRHTKLTANLASTLWQNKLFHYLIITGGQNQSTKRVESTEIQQKLFFKIPEEAMFIEPFSTNMKDNVVRSISLFKRIENLLQDTCQDKQKKITRILALTRIHSARRGLMTLKKQLCPRFKQKILFKVVSFNEHIVPPQMWRQEIAFKKHLQEEQDKIKKYLAQDDIAKIKKTQDAYWV